MFVMKDISHRGCINSAEYPSPQAFWVGHSWTLPRLATSRPLGERSEPFLAAKRSTASDEVDEGLFWKSRLYHELWRQRDNRRERVLSPALSQTSRGQRIKRERLGTRLPNIKDRANWSHDTFQPMRRRACVYQNRNQNIAPVIKNFHNNGRSGQNQSSFRGFQAYF